MELIVESIKFIIFSILIVLISKYILVTVLRKLAESLNLNAKTVGNVAGIATSMPEFLSVSFASMTGLIGTSIHNILTSNIINLVQYLFSIKLNKNMKALENMALRIDLVMVVFTIIIPIVLQINNIELSIGIVPAFILLLILFYYINHNAHNLYLKNEEDEQEKIINKESRFIKGKRNIVTKYSIYLVLIGIGLFIIGNLLSNSLEELCFRFNIPEIVIGIILGFITSIPELITFLESQKHHAKNQAVNLGVGEATNNLLTSNIINIFFIQSVGIILYQISIF